MVMGRNMKFAHHRRERTSGQAQSGLYGQACLSKRVPTVTRGDKLYEMGPLTLPIMSAEAAGR